ncbi:hypothetical protein CHS0354_006929 [Potamilus streckersoni]|uniref:Lysophospholipid transporter LplT n=1 Tax=Potamilus streckersoni TaxID=2493646 RepID=A0AAE0TFS6_9BIVA|nr:hypothetical protein CHS0354_006929 [Potamilus streckersoni]
MLAQFCSSLADNALLVPMIELMRSEQRPVWQEAALVPMFALFYVLLAPFVGAFADSMPKGKVMFISNGCKMIGCLMMISGISPLYGYGIVGLGAALYSPAKYGILTELLPASQLVKANGWIEGLTIASIILGVMLGGQIVGPHLSGIIMPIDIPGIEFGLYKTAILYMLVVYGLAALFNIWIPDTGVKMIPLRMNVWHMSREFLACNALLWKDKLGQISLAATTLFWGVSGNLRYIVLAFLFWLCWVRLAVFLVVPMNALLQHRGHNLMGAGRSIAVQNFNEQLCILALGAFYSYSAELGFSAYGAITALGVITFMVMLFLGGWYLYNLRRHPAEVQKLLQIARSDKLH